NLATGAWTYALNNGAANVQALADGENVSDTLTVTTDDGGSATITVSVTGTTDAAATAGVTTGSVTEDGTLRTSGTLSVSDVDTGEGSFVSTSSLTRSSARFPSNLATGAWTYALNNGAANVQALADGENVSDTLTVTTD